MEDLILRPVRLASSKPARKAYLNTALFLATSATLLGLAASAYTLFYMNYIPKIGIERVVHLQYGNDGSSPYGLVSLDNSIMSQQAYDVAVEIDLPRSPENTGVGNFMLDMVMLSPAFKGLGRQTTRNQRPDLHSWIPAESILFSSRRPAILTYQSDIVSFSKQVVGLPWYLLGWRRESERLVVPMAEGIMFEKGHKNIPSKVYLDIQCRHAQDLQVYSMHLVLRARFSGLRWLMYNHRIISFVIFTSTFWAAEVIFALVAWFLLKSTLNPADDQTGILKQESQSDKTKIKSEELEDDVLDMDDLDLSDTPRNFPTYGRQAPLRYNPKIKKDDYSEEVLPEEVRSHPDAAEADDESEESIDADGIFGNVRSDSGIGTSFSEGRGGITTASQRRRSRGGKGPS